MKDKWRNSAGRHFLAGLSADLLFVVRANNGQTPGTGAISGVVYDPGNRVVANAEVLATNRATQFSRSAVTTSDGIFRLPLLPEVYDVSVKAPGYAAHISPAVQVTVSETSSLVVALAALDPAASSSFGRIRGTVSNPRLIQLAAKYLF